jgi:hypothetical protein
MAIDLQVRLLTRPGTLALAADALGRAGINIDGALGLEVAGEGMLHLLVDDAELARRTLLSADIEIAAERAVAVIAVDNRPGAAAALLRRVASAGVNVDLLYTTLDGRLVLGSDNPRRLRDALSQG